MDGPVRDSAPEGKVLTQLWGLEQAPALSFNCESPLCCQVFSVFFCLPLVSVFLPSFLLPVCLKLPLCLSILHCFPLTRRKRLNKSKGSLCIIGEGKCLIQLNVERVRPKLKEIIFCSCLTYRASSVVNAQE